jgi:hypothetical protein
MASAMPVLPEVASISVSPGLDVAALLGAADHADRRPVLDRTGRVVALELAQDDVAARVTVGAGQALQRTSGVWPMASSRVL